jgi:hypothetical protein
MICVLRNFCWPQTSKDMFLCCFLVVLLSSSYAFIFYFKYIFTYVISIYICDLSYFYLFNIICWRFPTFLFKMLW